MANQYSVWPLASTSTVPLLVLRVEITAPPAAVTGVLCIAAGVVDPPLAAGVVPLAVGDVELPHAASKAAPPAKTGIAHHRLRMLASVPR
jgi:hypothetical protein